MASRVVFVLPLALVVSACGQSNGSEKKGGHPGMGMPPPEVVVTEVKPQSLPLTFEYVGQTAGSREVEVRSRVAGGLPRVLEDERQRARRHGDDAHFGWRHAHAGMAAFLLRAVGLAAGGDDEREQRKER